MGNIKWLQLAVAFQIQPRVRIERRDMTEDRWAISSDGLVLNRAGEWQTERLPSSRTEEDLVNTRWTLEEAFARVETLEFMGER